MTGAHLERGANEPADYTPHYLTISNYANACEFLTLNVPPDPVDAVAFRLTGSAPVELDGATTQPMSFTAIVGQGANEVRFKSHGDGNSIEASAGDCEGWRSALNSLTSHPLAAWLRCRAMSSPKRAFGAR